MADRAFPAKYPGHCPLCHNEIKVGEPICKAEVMSKYAGNRWQDNLLFVHAACRQQKHEAKQEAATAQGRAMTTAALRVRVGDVIAFPLGWTHYMLVRLVERVGKRTYKAVDGLGNNLSVTDEFLTKEAQERYRAGRTIDTERSVSDQH